MRRASWPSPTRPKEHAFRAVYRFLSRDPLLRPWSIVLILGDVMWLALFAVLPVLVLERFGDEPAIVGLTFAGFGLGAVVGGLIAFRLVGSVDRVLLASVGEIGMGLPLWLLLVHASPALLVVAFVIAGFANGLVNPALHTIVQLRTPRALRTKLYSFVITATSILGPAALVATGPALERFGVDPTLVVLVAIDTVLVLLFAVAGPAVPRGQPRARSHHMSGPSLLRDRGVRALVAAETISMAGSQMTYVVLPWFVLITTGSPAKMSVVVAAEMLPVALFGLASGAVTARIGARRTMLICDASRAILFTAIPTLHLMGMLSFAGLVALVFLVGIFMVPHASAQRVIVPELVGEDAGRVGETQSLLQVGMAISGIAGPALGGVLIAVLGETNVLYFDAASYAVSFVLLGDLGAPCEGRASTTRTSRAASSTACAFSSATGCFARGCSRSRGSTSSGARSASRCPCSCSSGTATGRKCSATSSARSASARSSARSRRSGSSAASTGSCSRPPPPPGRPSRSGSSSPISRGRRSPLPGPRSGSSSRS